MFIKHIKINGFGKIHNKEIDLTNGLNIIQGQNESGKSTISNFIKCMFYGISKNNDGNKYSEYEKFCSIADEKKLDEIIVKFMIKMVMI